MTTILFLYVLAGTLYAEPDQHDALACLARVAETRLAGATYGTCMYFTEPDPV